MILFEKQPMGFAQLYSIPLTFITGVADTPFLDDMEVRVLSLAPCSDYTRQTEPGCHNHIVCPRGLDDTTLSRCGFADAVVTAMHPRFLVIRSVGYAGIATVGFDVMEKGWSM